jgi:hypothetical protein
MGDARAAGGIDLGICFGFLQLTFVKLPNAVDIIEIILTKT